MHEARELPITSGKDKRIVTSDCIIEMQRYAGIKGSIRSDFSQCYMYCLWEQFGLVDDKRELSLNGMLTFFQRIPAYRAEVEKAISECKGIGNYLGIYSPFSFSFVPSIDCVCSKLMKFRSNPLKKYY